MSDTERLDFLIKYDFRVLEEYGQWRVYEHDGDGAWVQVGGWELRNLDLKDARSAIDALLTNSKNAAATIATTVEE